MGIGADFGIGGRHRLQRRSGTDHAVHQVGVGTDDRTFAHHCLASEHHTGMDDHIGGQLHAYVDVGTVGGMMRTPATIQLRLIRWRISASAKASCSRSSTP